MIKVNQNRDLLNEKTQAYKEKVKDVFDKKEKE